ncbi:MAG: tetratricopeptide repeat protein [Parvularculaceae bacterium]|nr:tetratricopeptide repeat protein [Parvularculaceae bacterium]
MRRLIFGFLAAASAVCGSASADQTDQRLDALFEQLRSGEGNDAEAIAEEIDAIWTDSQSDTVDLLMNRALGSLEAQQFDLAEALLDHVAGLSPNFAQGFALRGAVRSANEDQVGAIADLSRAVELEPRHFEARIALAEIMLGGGDARGAYAMLQQALEWNPHEPHARERARALRQKLDGQEI